MDMKKIEFFKVEGDKITRIRRHCPKCGPGVFLAEHKNRFSCGRCGYTEFKSSGKKEVKQPSGAEDKPKESVQDKVEMESEAHVEEKPSEDQSKESTSSDEQVAKEELESGSQKEEKVDSDVESSEETKN